ncbi:MAG: hypothetical protein LBU27_09215 [Candidatus Peribacteria bacterium]|nr:hypothetical protein [Candidatus Peribacteria bacterium]
MQYETSFYEKLYFYYAEQQEFQKALFVKKYYLEGFCEWRKLRVEM